MARKYSNWIYASVFAALVLGGAISSYYYWNQTEYRVLVKGCDYWENKGQEYWCKEPLVNQLEIYECDNLVHYIDTHNNPCSDLIVTGGGSKRYYTKFARNWAKDNLDKCDVPDHIRQMWGACR